MAEYLTKDRTDGVKIPFQPVCTRLVANPAFYCLFDGRRPLSFHAARSVDSTIDFVGFAGRVFRPLSTYGGKESCEAALPRT